MSSTRRLFVILSVCILSTPSTVFADGGTKRDSTIRVENEGSTQVGVAVGLTDAELTAIATASDPVQAFKNAGGKILNPEQIVDFKVRAGSHRVITVRDQSEGLLDDERLSVDRGETLEVFVNENGQIST